MAVVVSTLPLVVLRDETRTMASASRRELVPAATLGPALPSCDCTDDSAARAVGVAEYAVDKDGSGSPMGGNNGRCGMMSGRGLYDEMEFGVEVTRADGGGHSGRGGSCRTFSLGVPSLLSLGAISWSLSFAKPLLIR